MHSNKSKLKKIAKIFSTIQHLFILRTFCLLPSVLGTSANCTLKVLIYKPISFRKHLLICGKKFKSTTNQQHRWDRFFAISKKSMFFAVQFNDFQGRAPQIIASAPQTRIVLPPSVDCAHEEINRLSATVVQFEA